MKRIHHLTAKWGKDKIVLYVVKFYKDVTSTAFLSGLLNERTSAKIASGCFCNICHVSFVLSF